ncbi:MAG: hypothetical protein J6Y53_05050 [Alphaproteobacteria bacterium]|nr:hypothetical protein [Alphaproteobacteria bacterium]
MPFMTVMTIPIRHIDIRNTMLVCQDVMTSARIIPASKISGRKKVRVPPYPLKVMMALQIASKPAIIPHMMISLSGQWSANPEINCIIISSVTRADSMVEIPAGK